MHNYRRFLILLAVLAAASLPAARGQDPASGETVPRILMIGRTGLVEEAAATGESAVATNVPPASGGATNYIPVPLVNLNPVLETMQLVLRQQQSALQALEQSRLDNQAAARDSTQRFHDRLADMEDRLDEQRRVLASAQEEQTSAMERLNRLVLAVAAGLVVAGLAVMVLSAWFFLRSMNQVTLLTTRLQQQALALPPGRQDGAMDERVGGGEAASARTRLVDAMGALEQRLRHLEGAVSGEEPGKGLSISDLIAAREVGTEARGENGGPLREAGGAGSSAGWLQQGMDHLQEDRAEEALHCFRQALAADPENAELHLKLGGALERLRRYEEALAAYDAAIRADGNLTMAYLAKGGICNRLERYADALQCYEKALETQQAAAG